MNNADIKTAIIRAVQDAELQAFRRPDSKKVSDVRAFLDTELGETVIKAVRDILNNR